jgi:hypothetical protein
MLLSSKFSETTQGLLYQAVSNQPLAVFRILTGLWFMTDYIVALAAGWVYDEYIAPPFHFKFIGFEWVAPWPGWGMYVHFALVALAALGILLGYRYRLSLLIFLIGHLHIFFIDIVYNLNKSYLFILLAVLLFFMDAHSCWSLDAKRKPSLVKKAVPRWNILVFQLMLGVIYTYSGLSKFTADWLIYRQPMQAFLSSNNLLASLNPELLDVIISLFTYGGVLFDLSIIWLLAYRRTNLVANILQASFHLTNLIVLGIGTLSMYMIAVTLVLFPTAGLKKRLSYERYSEVFTPHRSTTLLLVVFIVLQLAIPHRHYLTGNDVNWTEKGHRFSWRLMTRTKSGSTSTFNVYDPASGQRWWIDPKEYLTPRQYRKMSAETDLVIAFAHYLEERWKEKGYADVVVRADVLTRLNMRKPQHLVPPDLDLTTVERTFICDPVSTELSPRQM